MRAQAPIRRSYTKGNPPRCVICDSENAEKNHVGGQNHVAWFTMPFCRSHHEHYHTLLRNAGVDLEYTPYPCRRLLRALKAVLVCAWMLLDALENLISKHEK
jgi:hypothetical protein